MTWRQRLTRLGKPLVASLARVVRGDAEGGALPPEPLDSVERRAEAADEAADAEIVRRIDAGKSAVPTWGIPPSQIPPRVELLRGRSSIELRTGALGAAKRVLVGYAIVVTFSFLTGDDKLLVALFAVVALIAGAVVFVRARGDWITRSRQEHAAGYTVWREGEVRRPQVDPETGFEIRPAGAPQLTKHEEAEALTRVRDIARHLERRRWRK